MAVTQSIPRRKVVEMLRKPAIASAIVLGLFLANRPAGAQGGPTSGWYQVTSGRYLECCGIAGPFSYPLPTASQGLIELKVDPARKSAEMTLWSQDRHTVFRISTIGPRSEFTYTFTDGMVFTDHIQFGDPFAPHLPGQPSFSYTVSNSADALRINGAVSTPCVGCADIPTEFRHTNVVAVRLPASPIIQGLEREGSLLHFRFTGEPSFDYFVEFTESLPGANWHSLTNFRAKIQTIEAVVTDSPIDGPARFYRIRKQDCNCD